MANPTFSALPAWTFPLRCEQDELLSSWLCRSAHLHGAMPYGFMSARFPGIPVWDRDVDLWPSSDLATAVDVAAGLPQGSAVAMSLSVVVAAVAASSVDIVAGHVPFVLAAGVFHRSRSRHGLQFCPECLVEGVPCFRRWGRLAFVVICPQHRTPVLDGCPCCDAPVMPHRAPVRALRACHACGADLGRRQSENVPAGDLPTASCLQDQCLAALAEPHSPTAVPGATGREFLHLVRTLTGVVASAAQLEAGSRTGRRQLELMRVRQRVDLLGRVAHMVADWPSSFRSAALALGLSGITFIRHDLPLSLAAEVALLPSGSRRHREPWRSVLDTTAMRRLRHADIGAYRSARAQRLLAASAA